MSKETGGSAFPTGTGVTPYSPGMTLRDYFAAKALPLAYKFWMEDYYHHEDRETEFRDDLDDNYHLIAESCYEMADAMLKARGA